MIDSLVALQHRFRNCGHLIEFATAQIGHGQFHPARIFGVILGFATSQSHVTLDREEVGEEAAREHDDQTGVREVNPEFTPGPVKAFRMRRHEIDEQAPHR